MPPPPPAGSEPELDDRLPRTDYPPVHYVVKINSVTELINFDTYKFGVFEAGGYEWSLCLLPKGYTDSQGKDYMSLYLSIEEPHKLLGNKKVLVKYRFFVFDNNSKSGEYVTFQEKGKELRAFSRAKTRWGLRKFLSLASFNNPDHGFRKGDYSKFGAEVLVSKPQRMKDTLTICREPRPNKITTIREFSVSNSNYQYSDAFDLAGRNWKLKVYPKRVEGVKRLFVYLEAQGISWGKKIYVKANLRVLNKDPSKNKEKKVRGWLSHKHCECDRADFMPWGDLKQRNGWFVHENELKFEVEISLISKVERG